MSNLLVVDWDYFFYNPLYATDGHDERFWLFDWGHRESPLYIDVLWPMRAAGFLKHGFDLPTVDVPKDWWDRFNIADDAVCEVSDSNMYSGIAGDGRVFDHVWLYDAHHDLFAIHSPEQLLEYSAKGAVTCEDWMWVHHLQGSRLHWRYPKWFPYGKHYARELPKWVNCDARKDDMGKLDTRMKFDVVSICRSGAWVPPWCDEQFEQFYQSCPAQVVQVDETKLLRKWDEQQGWDHVEAMKRVEES